MDCDTCGRHQPSSEITPLLGADGRLVMACLRCRRQGSGQRRVTTSPALPTAGPAQASAVLAPRR
jgi:hypothetical protein